MSEPLCALDVPGDVSLVPLTKVLWREGIPHRVIQQNGRQLVLVFDSAAAARVQAAYREGDVQLPGRAPAAADGARFWRGLRAHPIAAAIVGIALLCAPIGMLEVAQSDALLRLLTFTPITLVKGVERVGTLQQTLATYQWWRLITPSWLHFSLLHLTGDLVLFWEFARRIEARLGSAFLLLLFIWCSLAANLGQYLLEPGVPFGGLSGVVVGELGFVVVVSRLATYASLRPQPMLIGVMLASLLIFSTGVTARFGLNVANGAHWAGLAGGVVLAVLVALVHQRRGRSRSNAGN